MVPYAVDICQEGKRLGTGEQALYVFLNAGDAAKLFASQACHAIAGPLDGWRIEEWKVLWSGFTSKCVDHKRRLSQAWKSHTKFISTVNMYSFDSTYGIILYYYVNHIIPVVLSTINVQQHPLPQALQDSGIPQATAPPHQAAHHAAGVAAVQSRLRSGGGAIVPWFHCRWACRRSTESTRSTSILPGLGKRSERRNDRVAVETTG